MLSNPKSQSETLFEYVLAAFKVQEVSNLLEESGGSFSGDFLIWTLSIYDERFSTEDPRSFSDTIYAINPFAKLICELETSDQNPKTGIVINDEEIAALILISIVGHVEILERLNDVSAISKLPSEYLFELVNFIFEDLDTYNIIKDGGEGIFFGDFLVWAYDTEKSLYYAINPIKRQIYLLSFFSQPLDQGELEDNEDVISEVLQDLLAYIEDQKATRVFVFYKFSPNTYKAGKDFSKS